MTKFLDAAGRDVKAHWPADAVEVVLTDGGPDGRPERRFLLDADVDALSGAAAGLGGEEIVRLVGPYDPHLQLRDRELLVSDAARRKLLWPVLGRLGAVVVDGEVVGTWRPRATGRKLMVRVEPWRSFSAGDRAGVEEQAERLADHRHLTLAEVAEG